MLAVAAAVAQAADALPSWIDGAAKARIVALVAAVTEAGGKEFAPPADRIAVFDNDGCLWSEQPMYFQLAFAIDRVRALAPRHPEWKSKQPFKAAIEGDMKTLAAGGEHGLLELVAASHAGVTTDEFATIVKDWLATARHPDWWVTHQPFATSGNDFAARITALPIWEGDGANYLHVAASVRYYSAVDNHLRYRGKPASNVAPDYVDTGKIAGDHAWHTGLEAL